MKRLMAFILTAAILLCAAPLTVYASDTVPDGYTGVWTADDLYAVRNDLSGSYILMQDIDLTEATAEDGDFDLGYGWTPIGADSSHQFTGVFDGNGHAITGLQTRGNKYYSSLFGFVNGSTVKNLRLEDVSVQSGSYAGGLIGYMSSGTVQNCSVSGSVTGSSNYVGGLIGYVETGTVTQCYNTATVTGTSYVGGICGCYNSNISALTISDCYNTAAVAASSSCAGGILGYHIDIPINT